VKRKKNKLKKRRNPMEGVFGKCWGEQNREERGGGEVRKKGKIKSKQDIKKTEA